MKNQAKIQVKFNRKHQNYDMYFYVNGRLELTWRGVDKLVFEEPFNTYTFIYEGSKHEAEGRR